MTHVLAAAPRRSPCPCFAMVATATSVAHRPRRAGAGAAARALLPGVARDAAVPAARAAGRVRDGRARSASRCRSSCGSSRRDADETFARTLLVDGDGAARALLARGAWRGRRGLARDAARHARRGRRAAAGSTTIDAPIPVFAIEESFPTVAVVGFSRPALFIAERVLRECTADEVRAMVLHECAHVTHRDNLKRFLIRACPDVAAARQRARPRLDQRRGRSRRRPRGRRRSRLRARARAGADSRRPAGARA